MVRRHRSADSSPIGDGSMIPALLIRIVTAPEPQPSCSAAATAAVQSASEVTSSVHEASAVAQFLGQGRALVGEHIADHHVRALAGQRPHMRLPDSARPA